MDFLSLPERNRPPLTQRGTRQRNYGSERRRGRQRSSNSMRVRHRWPNPACDEEGLHSFSSLRMGERHDATDQMETAEYAHPGTWMDSRHVNVSRGSIPRALKESIPRYKYPVGRGSMHVNLSSRHFPPPASSADMIKYGKGRQSMGRPRLTRRGGSRGGRFGFVGQSRIDRVLEKKRLLHSRRGLLPPEALCDYISLEYPEIDGQCIIRFPFAIAEILRNRQALNAPLGLTITMTPQHEYRLFNILVEGYPKPLSGILVELPNIIESYKTIDGDLMFKSGDIAQMIYVYESSSREVDIKALRDVYHWEWKSGLTPSTHRIRTRKFKNFNVFDQEDIRNAELEVLELLHGLTRDSYEYVAQSEYDMVINAEKFQTGESTDRVISVYDNLDKLLRESGYASDTSDSMFGLTHTSWSARLETSPPRLYGTTARIGRPRRPRGTTGQRGTVPTSWRPFSTHDTPHVSMGNEIHADTLRIDGVIPAVKGEHHVTADYSRNPSVEMGIVPSAADAENKLGEKRRKQLLKKLKRQKKEKRKRRDEKKERHGSEISAVSFPLGDHVAHLGQASAYSQNSLDYQQTANEKLEVSFDEMHFVNNAPEVAAHYNSFDTVKRDVAMDEDFDFS
ncbi:TAF7-like Rna polymerase II TAF7L [Cardiosporidium cionae]|uniref:TAF7-like Rna polymerase II TAF7L n=1 Tax=Cardiosporidium cionae TaxID=476202 RepID=A0ABQ7JEU3_9APIC|nr:TAF7-like Rna polymerase II TAF7L [Cardiosporidium cionae]|eukprot:KAF8822530.1 TAF7-like Rna polymerase II TAF7L [Cardiosporidium cionae]